MKTRQPHPAVQRNLALIGGRGCGKTSVAKRIGRDNRNFTLLSLDVLIRTEMGGLGIPEIVEQEGWGGFREIEFRVLQRAAAFESGALLDCGGGIVVDLDAEGREQASERKVELLRERCLVVYLRRDTRYLESRIANDPTRPPLSGETSFHEIMERRAPWYERAAHWVVDCGARSKSALAEEILAEFARRGGLGEAILPPA